MSRTRIAPTPSGYLHLGNVLSFALTAAFARRTGASILLRIDDLDRDRADIRFVEDIFETLNFLEIPWDEGPRNVTEYRQEWSQLHRINIYRDALQQLRDKGTLFACDCSRSTILRDNPDGIYPGTCGNKTLPLDNIGCSWRIRTANAGLPLQMTDFVVRKKDGYPAYQLTSVLDDLYFNIDLVVRGEDLRPSTIAQQWLAEQLDRPAFRAIRFYHHPLLMAAAGQKLSKTAGATSIQHLRRQGLKPADICTMIARHLGSSASAENWAELATIGEQGLAMPGLHA
ncbi:MAG TPA: glutamate--tRNA ligase family protein [Puia sp.]|nr:glutamate--tRNA ligase family protein [Puia sp.]